MTQEEKIHNQYKNEIKNIFNGAELRCEDFDDGIGKGESGKKPDLKILVHNLFVEIKILFPDEEQDKNKKDAMNKLSQFRVPVYWINEKRSNYRGSVDSARKKFKNYPNSKTMVIFVCLAGDFGPSLSDLIEGKEVINIKTINDQPYEINYQNRDREIRQNKNYEIGALAEYCPCSQKIKVIHNSFAGNERKIDPYIFKTINKIEQYIYKFDQEKGNMFSEVNL